MKSVHETSVINPAFPLVYGGAFIWTLGDSLYHYWDSALPEHIVKALPMIADQSTAWTILAIFAAVASLYILALYVRLEFFEHSPPFHDVKNRPVWWRVTEFSLRALVIMLTTLKIMKWSDFSSLLEFYMYLSIMLFFWFLVVQLVDNFTSKYDIIGYLTLPSSISFVVYIERYETGTLLMIFALMIPIVLTLLLLIREVGKMRVELGSAGRRFFFRFFCDASEGVSQHDR